MSAALRLERFGAVAPTPTPVTAADVDNAWHEGHEKGLAQGRERSLDALATELRQIGAALHLSEDQAARIRQDTLASVVPILQTIVDVLGPTFARDRLLDALQAELAQIARSGAVAQVTIRCAPDLGADIRDCAARASDVPVTVDDSDPHVAGAEIRLHGGSIALDPMRAVSGIKTLIGELNHEE